MESETVTRGAWWDDEQSVTVLAEALASIPYLHLNDAKSKKVVTLPAEGVLISRN